METLVAMSQHRNESYRGERSQISDRFGSGPSAGFRGMNCRSFESGGGGGILPAPTRSYSSPPHPPKNYNCSNPISIAPKRLPKHRDVSPVKELWAGPAYCNSPPPSSLPMPTFSLPLRQKRSVSLDLPSEAAKMGAVVHQFAKSAPSSPTKASSSPTNGFFISTAFATQDLRRILNLDTADE